MKSSSKPRAAKLNNDLSVANVLTSVNDLVQNLGSEDRQQKADTKQPELPDESKAAATAAAAAAAAEIDKQLDRLDRLFAKANERRRKRRHISRLTQQQQHLKNESSKRKCEDCNSNTVFSKRTASNCNALNVFSISESSDVTIEDVKGGTAQEHQQQQQQQQQHQQHQQQQQQQVQQASNSASGSKMGVITVELSRENIPLVSNNASDDKKKPDAQKKSPEEETQRLQDFGYLKDGLSSGGEKSEMNTDCGKAVEQIELMLKSLQLATDHLAKKMKQQQHRQQQQQMLNISTDCSWGGKNSAGLKAEILKAQGRAACLRRCLRAAIQGTAVNAPGGCGSGSKAVEVGCRHRGTATHMTRDPIVDIKCKFERSLLYTRYDVNWPFLHIIAPGAPNFDKEDFCCNE